MKEVTAPNGRTRRTEFGRVVRYFPRRGNAVKLGSGTGVDGSRVGSGTIVGSVGIDGAWVGTGFGTVGKPGDEDVDGAVVLEPLPWCPALGVRVPLGAGAVL